jgi:flagellar motor switch protein FliN
MISAMADQLERSHDQEMDAVAVAAGGDGAPVAVAADPPADAPAGDERPVSAEVGAAAIPSPLQPFHVPPLQSVHGQQAQAQAIDLLRDVELHVKIELGRSRMLVEDVLRLGEGSVVELDKLAGDPVDVFVNDRLVARGEVLVLNDNFCVRISDIIGQEAEKA